MSKLIDACNICTGKLDANQGCKNGAYPFFTCAPEPLRINNYAFDCNAILLAGNNAQGNFHVQRYNGKFNAYQRTYVLTAKEGFDIDYIKYSIEVALSNFKRLSKGSQTKFLTLDTIRDLYIGEKNFADQGKTVAILRSIDNKIAVNKKINDNLQQQLGLMYGYWFTQFDFPDENGNPYRSSGGKMQYSSRLKKDIPEGWTVESVISNSISEPINPGVDPFLKKTYLATADVNGTSLSSGSQINYENRESRANMQPTVSSVWFAKMKNSIKHLFLNSELQHLIDETILSTGFCGLQCTDNSFEYVAAFIEHSYFEAVKNTFAHGATQEAVNNDDLLGIAMVIPSAKIIESFHIAAKPLYAQISRNICENQTLSELRDWLLPMLMNGQATIKD